MNKTLIISILAAAALVACAPVSVIPPGDGDGDGNIPGGDQGGQTVSIAYLKTLYNGAPRRIDAEIRISGAVVSSDREGNFYRTLVLDDGTAGIEIRMDVEEIFKRFMIHTRATVRCNGLWLGDYGGTLQLGAEPWGDYQTQLLSPAQVAEHVMTDTVFYGEVRPRTLRISELTRRDVSTFVAFERVRFVEQGAPWAETWPDLDTGAEPPSATNRHLVDASGENGSSPGTPGTPDTPVPPDTLIVRTSRHARFAPWPLPEGTGRIEGVITLFNGDYQLIVTDSEKFATNRTDRTDRTDRANRADPDFRALRD